ncbi:hypothetical protein ABEB36_013260 [Hypothenemus hampei]|uniref:Uncharacterized protein n=1 Tax=Hypothenemus hampei TaxID=57062 RepID=A0ABD1E9F9_HYPHA
MEGQFNFENKHFNISTDNVDVDVYFYIYGGGKTLFAKPTRPQEKMGDQRKKHRKDSVARALMQKKEAKIWQEEADSHLKSGNTSQSLYCYDKNIDEDYHLSEDNLLHLHIPKLIRGSAFDFTEEQIRLNATFAATVRLCLRELQNLLAIKRKLRGESTKI